MKKRQLAALALAAPLLGLSACTGGIAGLALSANWFQRTGDTPTSSANETLEYSVTFQAEAGNTFLSYGEGTYRTVLTAENTSLADGSTEMCYRLTSTLSVPVTYTVGGETASFEDTVTSDVWFRDVSHSLQPVRSVKTFSVHSPQTTEPTTLESAYEAYAYTYTVQYNADCTSADIEAVYTVPEADPHTVTVDLSDAGGTYLDNEQILFALRGLNMSSAVSFSSINPVKFALATVTMTEAPTSASEMLSFSINGTAGEHSLTTYTCSIGYSGSNPGQPQTLTYAGLTDANNNTYRNVLLRMQTPVMNSLGTFTYELTSAVFSA